MATKAKAVAKPKAKAGANKAAKTPAKKPTKTTAKGSAKPKSTTATKSPKAVKPAKSASSPKSSKASKPASTSKTQKTTKAKAAKPSPSKAKAVKKASVPKVTKKRSRESAISGPFQFEPYKVKRGEDYMNDTQLAHFKGVLSGWDNELREGVDRTVHHMKDDAAIFPDPLDRAAQEEEFTLELRTRDRERKLIKKIEESLELIDSGEYGYCESCGSEIGIRRLEARPTATLCIDCKTIDEIREKQEIG